MPLLPEHHTHGGSVSPQGAGARFSGPTRVYLGFQSRNRALPLLSRGGGARQLLSTGGVVLLPGGAPPTRAPDSEVEEILKITCRVKPGSTNLWLLFLLSIKDTWSPPTHLIYLTPEKIIIFFHFVNVNVSNQHSYGRQQRGTSMCECARLLSSAGELSVSCYSHCWLIWYESCFCFFKPLQTLWQLIWMLYYLLLAVYRCWTWRLPSIQMLQCISSAHTVAHVRKTL